MKTILLKLILILGVCQIVYSCSNEYSNDKLFPEEYHKILYFKNEGKHIFSWLLKIRSKSLFWLLRQEVTRL